MQGNERWWMATNTNKNTYADNWPSHSWGELSTYGTEKHQWIKEWPQMQIQMITNGHLTSKQCTLHACQWKASMNGHKSGGCGFPLYLGSRIRATLNSEELKTHLMLHGAILQSTTIVLSTDYTNECHLCLTTRNAVEKVGEIQLTK